MRKIALLLAGGALASLLCLMMTVMCSLSVGAVSVHNDAPAVEVKIENFSFGTGDLRVPVGTTVQWTNSDDIPHTVVSVDGLFKSDALDTGDSFQHRFDKAGTYPYFCSLHPRMTGRIIVR